MGVSRHQGGQGVWGKKKQFDLCDQKGKKTWALAKAGARTLFFVQVPRHKYGKAEKRTGTLYVFLHFRIEKHGIRRKRGRARYVCVIS